MFTEAIVRAPGRQFAQGLTTAALGAPEWERAAEQHGHYCQALAQCGLRLTALEADERYPDSTFVEDTAVVTNCGAVLARPGAQPREGEAAAMRPVLARFFPSLKQIAAPGTVDGGDVCQAGEHFLIGLSERTNHAGAQQLAEYLAEMGFRSEVIEVRALGMLHLKSGVSYIGENTVVVTEKMAGLFAGYERIVVSERESYAANCVRVNDRVLVAAGYPRLARDLRERGFFPLSLDMSEFQKMDGGLSCLSLRF